MSSETVETAWESIQNGSHIPLKASWDSIFSWFQQVECYPKLIWKGRESSTVYFCIGIGTRQSNLPVFTVRAFDTKQPQWDGFPSTLRWTPFGIVEWSSVTSKQCTLYKSTSQQQWHPSKGHIQTIVHTNPAVHIGQVISKHQNNCFRTPRCAKWYWQENRILIQRPMDSVY